MMRVCLKLALLLLPALTVGMMMIHAQPHTGVEAPLEMLLIPGDCTSPCFLGIQPGVTRVNEAMNILEASPWVEKIEPHFIGPDTPATRFRGWVYWFWKDSAAIWFRPAGASQNGYAGSFRVVNRVVDEISVATVIPFGSVRLWLGEPSGYTLSLDDIVIVKGVSTSATLRYRHIFLESRVQADAFGSCHDVENLWFQPTIITFFSQRRKPELRASFMTDNAFRQQAAIVQREVC